MTRPVVLLVEDCPEDLALMRLAIQAFWLSFNLLHPAVR